jgi:hypothetical protein
VLQNTYGKILKCIKIGYHKPEGELVFLPSMIDQGEKHKSKVRLAYKFDIYATSPVSRGDLYRCNNWRSIVL